MRKTTAAAIAWLSGIASLAAGVLHATGTIGALAAEAVIVIGFPVFVLFLALWWRAGAGDEDIPFIGY